MHTWESVRCYLAGEPERRDERGQITHSAKPGAWPRQFSQEYATADDREYFKAELHKLVGTGRLTWDQVHARLVYLRNEVGPKLNRNDILTDLRDTMRKSRVKAVEAAAPPLPPADRPPPDPTPWAVFARDPEECRRLYPRFDPTTPISRGLIARARAQLRGEVDEAPANVGEVERVLGPRETPADVIETLERLKARR